MTKTLAVLLLVSQLAGCTTFARKHRGSAIAADLAGAVGGMLIVFNDGCQEEDLGATLARRCDDERAKMALGFVLVTLAAGAGIAVLAAEAEDASAAEAGSGPEPAPDKAPDKAPDGEWHPKSAQDIRW